jgi:hypothetical protein
MSPNLSVAAAMTLVKPSTKREETMRKTIGVAALLLALVCSARAGEIQNGITTPSGPTTSVTQEMTPDGEISTTSVDGVAQFALDLLAFLPSLY